MGAYGWLEARLFFDLHVQSIDFLFNEFISKIMKENEIIVHFDEAFRSLRTTIGVLVWDNEGKTISALASRVSHKNSNAEFVEALALLHAIRCVY